MRQFQRYMAISQVDFARQLPLIPESSSLTIKDGLAELHFAGKPVCIKFTPQPERNIGRLSLPVLLVEMTFDGHTETEKTSFMGQFDRVFHRGGG